MAKYQKKKIQDTDNSNFGNYQEGIGGGGSPEKGDPSKHGHGVNSDYRQANNDTMQPRTDDGKFTYKSVNGQSIDPKYGPSRGKTVNPLLTGGENGIKISDVEQEFSSKSGAIWNKYKDKWYQKGSEYALKSEGKGKKSSFSTRVAGEAIWEVAKRRYDKVKGEFVRESKVFEEVKKGARTAEEQAAHQKAKATGQEQAVIEQATGGIKVKPGTIQNFPKQPTPSAGPQIPPSVFGGGVGQPTQKQPSQPVSLSQLSHTKEQLGQARKILSDAGVDTSGFTDEQLDQIVDTYIDFSEDSEDKSDSDAEKVVKKLGFEE